MDLIKIKSREQIEKEMREDCENDPSLDGFAKSVALGMCKAMSQKVHELYLLAEDVQGSIEGGTNTLDSKERLISWEVLCGSCKYHEHRLNDAPLCFGNTHFNINGKSTYNIASPCNCFIWKSLKKAENHGQK